MTLTEQIEMSNSASFDKGKEFIILQSIDFLPICHYPVSIARVLDGEIGYDKKNKIRILVK